MHQALYRKWRPETFDEVCGQEHITSVLKYQAETNTFSHAYLFCGSRGTGKTTCAKILSRAVNCLDPKGGNPCGRCAACKAVMSGATTDVLEMDAASNNGVEDIRDIRDEVIYAPSDLKYRVYIIDEVHMLSVSAFNALLKTLEEPPAHVIFILATTELHKLPATIVSRCQRFDFRRITTDVLASRLLYIAKEEGMTLSDGAARIIARQAQGGMRDAISLLELCAGSRQAIDEELVENTIGSMGREAMLKVVDAISSSNYDQLFDVIDKTVRSSKDIAVFWQELISLYRDILVVKTTKNAAQYLDLTDAEKQMIESAAKKFNRETLVYHTKLLDEAYLSMQRANATKRIIAEMTLVRMCDANLDDTNEALLSRIARLEEKLASGAFTAVVAQEPKKSAPKKEKAPSKGDAEADIKQTESKSEVTPKPTQNGNVRTLKTLRAWNEAVARVCESSPMTAPFWRQAKAYNDEDNKIIIKFGDEFEKNMALSNLTGAGNDTDAIRAALSICTGRQLAPSDIVIEVEADKSKNSENMQWLDEIIDAAEE